ncbi:MAG: hypothetical protein ACP5OG_06145 [Candidatus Nanoarchaeia archaeon]
MNEENFKKKSIRNTILVSLFFLLFLFIAAYNIYLRIIGVILDPYKTGFYVSLLILFAYILLSLNGLFLLSIKSKRAIKKLSYSIFALFLFLVWYFIIGKLIYYKSIVSINELIWGTIVALISLGVYFYINNSESIKSRLTKK